MSPVMLQTKFTPSSLSDYCREVFKTPDNLRSRFGLEADQAKSFFEDFLPAMSACRGHKEVRNLDSPKTQGDGLVQASFDYETLLSWQLSCSPGSETRHACHALTSVLGGRSGRGIHDEPGSVISTEFGVTQWTIGKEDLQEFSRKPDAGILHASLCGLHRGLEFSRQLQTSVSAGLVNADNTSSMHEV